MAAGDEPPVDAPRAVQAPGAGAGASPVRLTATGPRFEALPPLSLYIHFPWCVRKCPYCDFNSHETREAIPQARYAEALVADLEHALPDVWGRPVRTIFFGGGTPSLMAPETLDAILCAVRARLTVLADAEITLEANPGTVEAGRFTEYRGAGVNRLSLGVQSFDAERLRAIGRIHDDREAHAAAQIALRTFDNVNIDLMYGLPGQSLAGALADIDVATALGPQHVSAYHLTLEPNTLFHRFPPRLPDDETVADMQVAVEDRLGRAGYEHYETSAFARPGRRCRHNLNYWLFGDYLGIGAGAHGKLSFPDRIVRTVRHRQPKQYMEAALGGTAESNRHEVAAADLGFEVMMNALRLVDGFALELFPQRTGMPLTAVLATLDTAERDGLIERDHAAVRPTLHGQRFLNELLQRFLPG